MQVVWCVLLLIAVNGAPVIAGNVLGGKWAKAVDLGRRFVDGRPLLGHSKTWRGLFAALLASIVVGALIGLPWWLGCLFGLLSMLGDLLASFTKRRLGIPPSGRARFLDQLPEALLPLVVLRESLALDWPGVLIAAAGFTVFEWVVSPWLYQLRIRRRPY